jgi:hypothetical protein
MDKMATPNQIEVFVKLINAKKQTFEINIIFDSKNSDDEDFAKVMMELLIFLLRD